MMQWFILIGSGAKGLDATIYEGSEEGAHLYCHERTKKLGIAYWDEIQYRIVRLEDIPSFKSLRPLENGTFEDKYKEIK